MKTTHLLTAMVVLAGFAQVGEAGLFDRMICRKAGKRCDCDCVPTCQPVCCKPIIVRPCMTSVHCYQRQCSSLKPVCCDVCCAPADCCTKCCPAPSCCDSSDCCDTDCNDCCNNGGCDAGCCDNDCCDGCCDECCPSTCCDLAQLIYESQTGCYARHRKRAIHRLSDRYDCVCHPEVMCTLIYALNDADEHVRAKAADEIGDQLRKNPCCCSDRVVCALTCALADCHWAVRFQAKQALKRCGYQVVKPCKMSCCDLSCCDAGCCETDCHATGKGSGNEPSPAAPGDLPAGDKEEPAPEPASEPVKASPEPPSAYFQMPVIRQTSATTVSPAPVKKAQPSPSPAKKSLAALLELFD
ncbi:MAG: hypothetical protein AB7I48_15140 [Planctomycetaceae bacterium]